MKRALFLLSFFVLLFPPSFVMADTVVTGVISSDTTWSPENGVYIIDSSFSVASGTTLTIKPGTIVKAKTTDCGRPSIYGKIIASGTDKSPIYFTSFYDDDVGGNTDNTESSIAEPGQWQGLYFKTGSEGDFDYVNISYAGDGGNGNGDYVGIENEGGILNIKHSNIHENYRIASNGAGVYYFEGIGIYNKNGTLTISDSVIDNNSNGISSESGNITVSNSTIKNNSIRGFGAGGEGSIALVNNNFIGNKRTGGLDFSSIDFTHSGNTSNDITDRGFGITGLLTKDTILHSDDLPLLLTGGIIIPSGKTLTLKPGTVLKMGDDGPGYISVSGSLIVRGTKNSKIYLTSKKDDSVGGDSNGDGTNTVPEPKNWSTIYLEAGSKADFDNVVVRYAGYNFLPGTFSGIYQHGAEFSVSNSLFEQNYFTSIFQDAGTTVISNSEFTNEQFGILFKGGSAAISQSSLHGNTDCAIYNQGSDTDPALVVDAESNWWGSADGPKDQLITPTGTGDTLCGNIFYIPFLTAPPGDGSLPQAINPVIIIPGIMGSAYKNKKLIIDPILHTYDDLIATLAANGYEKDKNLFTFPYEWRDSNILTANLLKNKISEVKSACVTANLPDISCDKVDLVAHSMGGLVAREYIQSDQYKNDVDQIIFLGTPHRGSPQAYLQWEGGSFLKDPLHQIIQLKFTIEAMQNLYLDLFHYIHNRPIYSVQELLPIFDYLKDKETEIIRTYPDNYPRNIFLEALNSNTGMKKLLNSGVSITNIIGNKGQSSTIETIRIVNSSNSLWIDGEPDGFNGSTLDHGLEAGEGDGTVTTYGSTIDDSIPNRVSDSDHSNLPSNEEENIFNILTRKTIENGIHRGLIRKLFIIHLHSPIDMIIIAPDGKRIGKNFETGEEYNEIPDAFYSGYQTNEEYITIPNPLDGEYKIELQGTNNGGNYGVVTNYISDDNNVSKEYSGTIAPGEIQETTIITGGAGNDLSLEIKIKEEIASNLVSNPISFSGSRRHISGEVLGASIILDEQTVLQLQFIKCLEEVVKLLNLYMLQLNK